MFLSLLWPTTKSVITVVAAAVASVNTSFSESCLNPGCNGI